MARCAVAEKRLEEAAAEYPLVIINHFPLRQELVRLWRIPRFSLWCGTKRTKDWHVRFRAKVVVYGHLHIRSTDIIDGVRFEEVSLGYPRHWNVDEGMDAYLPRDSTGLTNYCGRQEAHAVGLASSSNDGASAVYRW